MTARWLARPTALAFLLLVVPTVVFAHPLGNFTINHYAEVRVARDHVNIDVVIDMAEIPALQERQRLDADRDGVVGEAEREVERQAACGRLAGSLVLTADSMPLTLSVSAAGLSFPPGAGGLSTLRLVCEFRAALPTAVVGQVTVGFTDRSYVERIGWREMVATADGVEIVNTDGQASTRSARLTSYPVDMLSSPLDMRSMSVTVVPGGIATGPPSATDAQPLVGGPAGPPGGIQAPAGIPGGVGDQLSALIQAKDLTPPVVGISLLLALLLGAVHAVSPGHGKTVMAAYLVGSRGTARHAVALGLTVTVSHTIGIVVLAAVTLFAAQIIPPERLYPILGLASGATVIGIGAWLLIARFRALRVRPRRPASVAATALPHHADHGAHEPGEHTHGSVRHTHLPPPGRQLSWRSLVLLGLAGGRVPSASALLLLLGAIAIGRPAYGLALAIAFGAGMAIVLSGIGYLLVVAGDRFEHWGGADRFRRFAGLVPWATAAVVLASGVFITSQALRTTF